MVTRHFVVWYVILFLIALLGAGLPFFFGGSLKANEIVIAIIVAAVIPIVLIWGARMLGYPVGRALSCPRCGTEMPMFRTPRTFKQAMWGGARCPTCATEIDARGREVTSKAGS